MRQGHQLPISISNSRNDVQIRSNQHSAKRQHSSTEQLNIVNLQNKIMLNEFFQKDSSENTKSVKAPPSLKHKNKNNSNNYSSNNIEYNSIQEINQPPALKPYYKILNQTQLVKLNLNPYELRDRDGMKRQQYKKQNCIQSCFLCFKLTIHIIMYPIKGLNWLTMPNPDGQKASLTILISLLWIAALSYLASWWSVSLSCSFEVSPYIIGATLVPWLIALRQFESYRQINLYFKILVRQGVKAHSKNLQNNFRDDELEIEKRIIFGGSLPKMESFELLNQRLLKPSLSDLKIGMHQSYSSVIMQICMLLGGIFLLYTAFIQSPLKFRALSLNSQFLFLLFIIWLKLCMNFFTKCIVRKSLSAVLILIYATYIILTVIIELQIIKV